MDVTGPLGATGPSSGAGADDDVPLARPYSRTGGRTRPAHDLPLEALVATVVVDGDDLQPEHRQIADLCRTTRSVAEVSALLRLPLGVVRVLISDMASEGLVVVHPVHSAVGATPDTEFLERVLSGLQRL